MKADQVNGTESSHDNDSRHNLEHAAMNGMAPESSRSTRPSQETLRRDSTKDSDPTFNAPPELARVHVLVNHDPVEYGRTDGAIQRPGSASPPELAVDVASQSYSRESTVEPADFARSNGHRTTAAVTAAVEDEDVWEDEEDTFLMDEHGNIIYEGPAYEDSASEFSDGADVEDLKQRRRSYREATQQYRKSRRALLLSGLSSYASSPSSEELSSVSPTEPDNASASPSASLYEPHRQPNAHESYHQPHLAEAVDTGDTGGRSDDLRFDYDSVSDTENPSSAGNDLAHKTFRVKEEPSESISETTTFTTNSDSLQTPRVSAFDIKPTTDHGSTSEIKTAMPERLARPPSSPRAMSSPLGNVSFLKPEYEGIRQRRSLRDLKPSPSLPDTDKSEPVEAYMTPRLSLTTVDEEAKPTAPKTSGPQSPGTDSPDNKAIAMDPRDAFVSSRQENHPFSLWDYLKEEVLATDFDATQEMKWERVTNFISIPFWMEKIILFGFVVCLDSFLYTFTILPLRFGVAMWTWVGNSARWILGGQKRYLHSSQKCDILKMLLIVLSCVILANITDASKMYHSVRGQDVVKLSVIFNVLEIADRLCCSFGQDLLDSLFSRSTLARRKNGRQPYLRPIGFFCLSLCYVLAHTLVLFYQLVTLNVAINSYDNALLTLLLSNQFVEIKSSVFKKFEKENVFQMTCADIVERFQLTLMLSAIGLRNLIELSGGSLELSSSPLPASFTVFPSLSLLETVLTPVCIVLASECIVDWLKHAFITKFNHIRPAVYGRFMDVLCRDLVVGGPSTKENSRKHTFVDQSPIISRRLGFAALPLACLLVRLILQIIGMIGDTSHIDECIAPISPRETGWIGVVARKLGANDIDNDWVRAMDLFVRGSAWALTLVIAWAFLVAVKLLLGTNLVSFASRRYATMHERENEESLNARDRAPIGTNKDERSYDKSLGRFVDRSEDDAIQIKLDGTHVLPTPKERDKEKEAGTQKVKKENSLMEVSRYNMVRSRIW